MKCHLRVLDVSIALSGPDDVVGPVVAAYRRFVVSDAEPGEAHPIEFDPATSEGLRDGRERVPLIAGINPTLQVYDRFLNAIFDRSTDYAVLHAAAFADGQKGASLIAGPSGHGKTSMTLELVNRGFRFLSDDYAPMDLATGNVYPYPRTVGIIADGDARIPSQFLEAAAAPDIPRLMGKSLVDVGEVMGECVLLHDPVPVSNVFVLDAGVHDRPSATTKIEFGVWADSVADVESRLSTITGVKVVERRDRDDLSVWRIELDHDKLSTGVLSKLLNEKCVAFSYGLAGPRPDFEAEPRLDPLTRRETATFLCREMQNRRESGQLMQRFGGDTTALFVGVAAALVGAKCWKVTVGRFEPTVRLIQQAAS
jgi:hypothetical protein